MAIEPPSQSLLDLLQSLQLATPQRVLACQGFAKALCQDLPAFDSVWIDALVQGQVLTPFQAKLLVESPAKLRQGAHVLIDRLPNDGWPVRYIARPLAGGAVVTLARIPLAPAQCAAGQQRFTSHLHQVRTLRHRGLCLPTECEATDEALIAIGPLSSGAALDDLLVRRGRFPGGVVIEVARQLIEALAALETAGALHGDMRLRNILLEPTGRIQVVHSGLLAAAYPQVSIHWPLPIACHHGLAPELIGTHAARTMATEMYAVGCLLWHVLAGRPPYLPADPLQQMAAHQKGVIPDVLRLAPETPPTLAALISRLTAHDPRERPGSMSQVSHELRSSTAKGRSQLAAFQTSTQTLVPVRLGSASRGTRSSAIQPLLTAAVVATAVGLFLFPKAGPALLESAGRMLSAKQAPPEGASNSQTSTTSEQSDDAKKTTERVPTGAELREESPHSGRIVLHQAGPYAASEHSAVGELTIEATPGLRAEILVDDQPLKLTGEVVRLANVVVRRAVGSLWTGPLIEIEAQSVILEDCELIGGRLDTTAAGDGVEAAATIAWTRLDSNELRSSELQLTRTVVLGGGPVLQSKATPHRFSAIDCAFLGTGPVCDLRGSSIRRPCVLQLTRTTLRETGPLLRQLVSTRPTPVQMELRQSLLAPRVTVGLIEAIGQATGSWRPAVTIDSVESYLVAHCEPVATRSTPTAPIEPVDTSNLEFEGLLTAKVQFHGPLSLSPADSVLVDYSSDIMAEGIPGFRVGQ